MQIKSIFDWITQLINQSLPNRCLLCHQQIHEIQHGFCAVCLNQELYQQDICLGCGKGITQPMTYCGSCLKTKPLPVIAPTSYHSSLGRWVGAIKYHKQFAALDILTDALITRVQALQQMQLISMPQVLLPVPLHTKRLRKRGFNQAFLIAEVLSERLRLPILENVLIRDKHTQSQAGLDGKQRRNNLKNSFELRGDIPYQSIAIIDDVVTTGTTIKEIARTLKPLGLDIQVWCLARAEAPGLLD